MATNQTYTLVVPGDPSLPGAAKNVSVSTNTSKTIVWASASRDSQLVVEGSVDGEDPWVPIPVGEEAQTVLRGPTGSKVINTDLDFLRLVRRSGSGGEVLVSGSDDGAGEGVITGSLLYTDLVVEGAVATADFSSILEAVPDDAAIIQIVMDIVTLFDDGGGNVDMRATVHFPGDGAGVFALSTWLGSYKVGSGPASPAQAPHKVTMAQPVSNNGTSEQGGQLMTVTMTSQGGTPTFDTLTAGRLNFKLRYVPA